MSSETPAAAPSAINEDTLRKGTTIVAFVLAFLMPPVGLVLSIGALIWAKKSGERGTLAIAGIVIGAAMLVLMVVVSWWILTQVLSLASDGGLNMDALCAHRDRWGWLIDSLRYACR